MPFTFAMRRIDTRAERRIIQDAMICLRRLFDIVIAGDYFRCWQRKHDAEDLFDTRYHSLDGRRYGRRRGCALLAWAIFRERRVRWRARCMTMMATRWADYES